MELYSRYLHVMWEPPGEYTAWVATDIDGDGELTNRYHGPSVHGIIIDLYLDTGYCAQITVLDMVCARQDTHSTFLLGGLEKLFGEDYAIADQSIQSIYDAYPRKAGSRQKAWSAIREAIHRVASVQRKPDGHTGRWPPPDAIQWLLDRTKKYAEERKGEDQKFTPHPTTWFNQERYLNAPLERPATGRVDAAAGKYDGL